jgi:hypothetical protein
MDKLIPIYLKIKPKLKEKLQAQARTERISMASLISEMLEMGLEIRPKIRWQSKGGLTDLKKAKNYIDYLINLVEGHNRPKVVKLKPDDKK